MAEKRKWVPYNEMTDEQKREFHRLGGLAAAKKRHEAKLLRDKLELLLASPTKSGDVTGDMCWALIVKALSGDVKAFEAIRSTLGQDAPTKIDATVDNNIIKVSIDDGTETE